MAQFHLNLPDSDLIRLKSTVGKGKMSEIIRNFVHSYSGEQDDLEITILRKKLALLEPQKRELDSEYESVKSRLEEYDAKVRIRDLRELQELQEEAKNWDRAKLKTFRNMASDMINR